MRKLLIFFMFCCLGCGEDNNKTKEATDIPEPRLSETSVMCFSTTGEEYTTENKTLQDSTELNLEIKGNLVTGSFNWIPAEKDSRKGSINATKNGDDIKGSYYLTQEGIQDTISIEIELLENSALVTTMTNSGEEMRLEVEKVDCPE